MNIQPITKSLRLKHYHPYCLQTLQLLVILHNTRYNDSLWRGTNKLIRFVKLDELMGFVSSDELLITWGSSVLTNSWLHAVFVNSMYYVERQSEVVRENKSHRTVWNQCCLSPWVGHNQKSSESDMSWWIPQRWMQASGLQPPLGFLNLTCPRTLATLLPYCP